MHPINGEPSTLYETSVWHYGDPFGEQNIAHRHGAYCINNSLQCISLSGEDSLTWLNTLSSQLVLHLAPGECVQTLILDANGRIDYHMWVYHNDSEILLITSSSHIQALTDYLTSMIFWSKVEISVSEHHTVLHLLGPTQVQTLPGNPPHFSADLGELACVTYILNEDEYQPVIDFLSSHSVARVGMWVYEAARVASLNALFPLDTDTKTVPHEINLINTDNAIHAVHLDKGCYRGQETVARIHNLGKPPRRLVLLHFAEKPEKHVPLDTPIMHNGRKVGRVGTVIDHYELGTIGLGLIKRNVLPDAELTVDGMQVTIDAQFYHEDDTIPVGKATVLEYYSRR